MMISISTRTRSRKARIKLLNPLLSTVKLQSSQRRWSSISTEIFLKDFQLEKDAIRECMRGVQQASKHARRREYRQHPKDGPATRAPRRLHAHLRRGHPPTRVPP